jgi:phospholipid-binding lipoprotein MlaA
LAALIFMTLGMVGCATLPEGKHTPGDPFERMNRSVWVFDNALDHAVLRPVARGYVRYTPSPVRQGISNFVTNLTYSDTVVNDFLQAKFNDGANDVARLVVNTVLGIGGLFDPASHMDLDRHDRDFGQTLGVWGLNRGPFLMLPFLGPSDVRDAFGRAGDAYMEPYPYVHGEPAQYALWGVEVLNLVNERSQLLDEDRLIDSAFDSYAFVRNAYLQQREFKVHGSRPETPEQLFPGADLGPDSDTGAPANPAPPGAPPPR